MNRMIRQMWWKILTVLLLLYTIVAGFLLPVPPLPILHESIRNLYFHVPMWFAMTIILFASMVYSIRYLLKNSLRDDILASSCAKVGVLFGILGLITGMEWAKTTWGAWWNNDPKQTTAAISLLIYLAYFVLRNSMDDIDKRARISAVANIFFYAVYIPLIFIVPRLTDSLHPGNGGNPGFNAYDLDGNMRAVFYPSILAWTFAGAWLITINGRIKIIEMNLLFDPESGMAEKENVVASKFIY